MNIAASLGVAAGAVSFAASRRSTSSSSENSNSLLSAGAVALGAAGISLATTYLLRGENTKRRLSRSFESSTLAEGETTAVAAKHLTALAGAKEKKSREALLAHFGPLAGMLTEGALEDMKQLPETMRMYLSRMLRETVPGGKLNRGVTVAETASAIANALGNPLNEDGISRANVLGWCIEWIQASFLVADDVMDASITRRGKPCWYRNEDIGLNAINDSLILLTHASMLLRHYFEGTPEYVHLHHLLLETTYRTELGQLLDLTTQPLNGPIDLNLFTEERYRTIVRYKTAFYSFYAPVALGMVMNGIHDPKSLGVAHEICMQLGEYFQIQDDYLDCYGDPSVIGKVGTDIQDSKCSWLVVQALKRSSPAQRDVIERNYGKDDEECIGKVKSMFEELALADVYAAYEAKVYDDINQLIESASGEIPKEIFVSLLGKIYKRSR